MYWDGIYLALAALACQIAILHGRRIYNSRSSIYNLKEEALTSTIYGKKEEQKVSKKYPLTNPNTLNVVG